MISSWKRRDTRRACGAGTGSSAACWLLTSASIVTPKRGLHLRLGKEAVQHDLRVGVLFELDDDAHTVAVGLVADVGDALEPLVAHLLGHGRR